MSVLCLVEVDGGAAVDASLRALGFARGLAASELAASELAASERTTAVVAAATDRGNEVMAHLGALTSLPMAAPDRAHRLAGPAAHTGDTGSVSTHDIGFRPLLAADLPLLAEWLGRPHVATWWREPSDLARVRQKYLPCLDGRDPTELFLIEVDGAPAGFIQRYLVADNPEWERELAATGAADSALAAGIDYLIGDLALTGKGLGSAAIRQFTDLTFRRYPQAASMLVDVSQANVASWRALEKAGYTRCWGGELDTTDPSDEGPSYLYRKRRVAAPVTADQAGPSAAGSPAC